LLPRSREKLPASLMILLATARDVSCVDSFKAKIKSQAAARPAQARGRNEKSSCQKLERGRPRPRVRAVRADEGVRAPLRGDAGERLLANGIEFRFRRTMASQQDFRGEFS